MIAEFSLLLIVGMSLMWCLMPRAQVTAGFFRIQMMIVMGLSVLAILTLGALLSSEGERLSGPLLRNARIAAGSAVGFAYFGSIVWLLGRRVSGTVAMVGVLLSSLTSLILARGGVSTLGFNESGFHLLSSLATAGVLGGVVTGMLLGHWYLTAPTMSITPLNVLCWWLALAIAVRFGISTYAWLDAGHNLHGGVQWTWFALRWLGGILGPFVIAIMAIRILRYRNTQAATGVLFAGVILAFIGEMSAALLYAELRLPF